MKETGQAFWLRLVSNKTNHFVEQKHGSGNVLQWWTEGDYNHGLESIPYISNGVQRAHPILGGHRLSPPATA